ncbi:putative acid trehalase [Pseudovirgaria hyperparasitica]|uniref:alpha,alpha-trehalase n=1 Tax=Pseudovirgaria hyperparasitica TaxID=470096 RepID=A0A6A6WF76_9PEZI|nr:putative acid trehalase [Pseudovirgaria hyperparasitica]KAF2761478.1 putative acid trehalase [Pseudovirgaria hyperparasitica]
MSLANGYLGISIAALGPFFEVDEPGAVSGWPLFTRRQAFGTIAGFYDSQPRTNGTNFEWLYQYGGESVISGVPHWAGLTIEVDGNVLDASTHASQIFNFSSTLDMKKGLLSWDYTWAPSETQAINIEYNMFVHKLYVNQAAVQLKMTPSRDTLVTITDVLAGDAAVRTDFVDKGHDAATIWSAVRPNGVSNVTAYIYSTLTSSCNDILATQLVSGGIGGNQSSIAQSIPAQLLAKHTTEVEKHIGGASSDAFSDPQKTARSASLSGADAGFASLLESHVTEWHNIFSDDSVDSFRADDGSLPEDPQIVELQILAVSNPYQLLQQTVGENAIAEAGHNINLGGNSISVCGLGSDCYAGWIFWDAETWMQPGLVVSQPQVAKQIAQYRVNKFPAAQENINTAYQSSKNQTARFSPRGAAYPWISGRFGNSTAAGPAFDYEYHLNGDIGLEFVNYWIVSGDIDYFRNELFPIYDAIATFYTDLLDYNETTKLYSLKNATDPDEYANHVDKAGFTTALIEKHLNNTNRFRHIFNMPTIDAYSERASSLDLPVNEKASIILEYDTMNGSINVKQADVVLIDDFLDYPNPYSLSNLDYYAGRQSQDGPGMTYSVFSIVANKFSPSGCSAYTYDIYGTEPYIRGPWFQYSEQLVDDPSSNGGANPAYPFLTGTGGSHRVAVFGYLGLNLSLDALSINPNLPPQIPHLTYRTIYWQGHAITARSNQTHTTLSRLPHSLPSANSKYTTSPIPISHGLSSNSTIPLAPNSTITLPNRRIGTISTWENNIAQCRPLASSPQPYVPGQMPLSAVDGAISTVWQPASATEAWISVDLSSSTGSEKGIPGDRFYPITAIHLAWSRSPPISFSVVFSNSTLPPFGTADQGMIVNVTTSQNVAISEPYDPATAGDIVGVYLGNTTNVTLESPVWSGRYATLVIEGTQAGGEKGAQVAEFGIIREGGESIRMGR